MNERIVITGLGAISPLGLSVKESWDKAINGVSGVGPITHFDASEFLVQVACQVKGFDPVDYMPAREARRLDLYEQLAVCATKEALAQSGLEINEENAPRIGVIVSSAIGGIGSFEEGVNVDVDEARKVLGDFENVTVIDDMSKNEYPMPIISTDTDETYVGRIRKDIYADNILHLWGVADQVRVGAATNAVRIAQKWIKLEENA